MKIYCDRLPRLAPRASVLGMGALTALAAVLLAGCGGGGGGGGGSTTTTGGGSGTEVFSGTVTNTTTDPSTLATGYTVRFDSTGPTTTTSAIGVFSLNVPASDITGNDTLYVIDSTGVIQSSSLVTLDSAGLTGISLTIGPPLPGGVPLLRKL